MDPSGRILQWNCHSISNKKSDLIYLINKHHPCILAMSETWLRPDSNFRLPGYVDVRKDRLDGFGGVALYFKNNISFSHISIPSTHSIEAVAARVEDFTIVSLYIPIPSKSIIRSLSTILNSLPKPLLVLGDLNCHHSVWGCGMSDVSGIFLLDSLDSLDLCIINDGSPTRRTRINELTSAVDLSLCSPELASLMSWCVLPSSHGSDHFPIILSIRQKFSCSDAPSNPPLLKYHLNDSKLQWEEYGSLTGLYASKLPSINSLNLKFCVDGLIDTILQCANMSFPLKKGRSIKIPSPPWWDKECSEAVNLRKAAESAFCHSMTRENFSNLNKIIAKTKRLFHKKKRDSWKAFCCSIGPNTPLSLIWKKIHRYRRSWCPPFRNYSPSQGWADSFMAKIAPQYCPHIMELPSSVIPISNDPLDQPFTFLELKYILSSVKDSAPGIDGIPYSFLSNANDSLLKYYLCLVNAIFESNLVPVSWKSQYIIPILKPNKDSTDPNSYRPIALSSVLAKIAEHLIKNRLEWFLERHNLLANTQYGFRKGRSTMDSLAIFTTDIRLSFTRNESVIGAFLDISAAYDSVQLPILKNKLYHLKVPAKLANLIMNLLSERYIYLRCSDPVISSSRVVWRGLPQGSVLSPLLYNVYTYDLESSVGLCRVLQYADDLLLYTCHQKINIASSCLTDSLQNLSHWLFYNGLDLSPSKSNIVLFSRKRNLPDIDIRVNGSSIPVKESVKFLGLILDNKLNGSMHCEYIVNKCEKNINVLRCLAGVWWGAHPFNLKILYNAIIRSVLDYGSFLLEPANKKSLKKYDLIQSKALRIISGGMKSSPIKALQVECVDSPLYLRRQFLANRFFFRSIQFLNHPLFPKLQLLHRYVHTSRYWRCKNHPLLTKSYSVFQSIKDVTYRSTNLPIFDFDYNVVISQPRVILNFDICKGDLNADEYFREILKREWKGWHTIFTDASKLSPVGCVGCGVFHSQYDIVQKVKCPPESSVFTGECVAILEAIKFVLLFKLHRSIIFSDSRSSLQSLLSNPFSSKIHNPIIFQIKHYINQCSLKGYETVLAWIPGHVGIFGNERVDRVAKDAVACGDKVPFLNYPHDLGNLPKVFFKKSWDNVWSSQCKHRSTGYAKIQPNILCKPWFARWNFSKRHVSSLIRMRLGHCCVPTHLKRIHIMDSSICECGLDEGDLNHLFFSCPLLDHSSFYSSLISLKTIFPTSISVLLSSPHFDIYKTIINFICDNNINV